MRKTEDSHVTMRKGNSGLTVKINLWSLEKVKDEFDSESARLWIKGQATHADTGEVKKFNDAGELLTILGQWNVAKLNELKK
jgi:hypothetical protein